MGNARLPLRTNEMLGHIDVSKEPSMVANSKPYAFMAFKFDETDSAETFYLNPDREKVLAWSSSDSSEQSGEREETLTEEQQEDKDGDTLGSKPLARWIDRLSETLLPYYSLIGFGSQARYVFTRAMMNVEILHPIQKKHEPIEIGTGWRMYAVEFSDLDKLEKGMAKIDRMRNGISALPSSTLMSLVAAFDSVMADLIATLLKLQKEKLNISDKFVPISEVLSASSVDEIVDWFVGNQVYELLRGSHDDQVRFIEKTFDIEIRAHWWGWKDFIEVFERRNLLAHGEREFTSRYEDNCKKHGETVNVRKAGEQISLPNSYLYHAVDIFLEFGILLAFSLWRKNVKSEEKEAFEVLNQMGFLLIKDNRLTTANNILKYGVDLKNTACSETTRRMMVVNRANALRKMDKLEEANKVLEKMDWNSSSDQFRISVAAVQGDVGKVVSLMEVVKVSKSLGKRDFREWPVFDHVRSDQRFQEEFARVFGEPLVAEVDSQTSESGELAQTTDVDGGPQSRNSGVADSDNGGKPDSVH